MLAAECFHFFLKVFPSTCASAWYHQLLLTFLPSSPPHLTSAITFHQDLHFAFCFLTICLHYLVYPLLFLLQQFTDSIPMALLQKPFTPYSLLNLVQNPHKSTILNPPDLTRHHYSIPLSFTYFQIYLLYTT
uniref:Uncharacterized protein n=1 Tax=Opuntia streptacantha TaxID=393608 RepID=A0A7C9E2K0_OPUST